MQNGATALTLTVFKDHWPCTQILREAGAPDCPTNREAFQVLQQGYFNFNKRPGHSLPSPLPPEAFLVGGASLLSPARPVAPSRKLTTNDWGLGRCRCCGRR